MKRFLALFVACMMAAMPALAATDYTVAEKLVKQLSAGSGFSGTITLEADTESFSTVKPIVLDVDYIFVRPETVSLGEHRADITLMDGETAVTSAHVQVLEGNTAIQSDLIGSDWYALSSQGGEAAVPASALAPILSALSAIRATEGLDPETDDILEDALQDFTTRIDIWIEGYRQSADLHKLEDGTSAMQVSYRVSPASLKAQIKQMVFDLLSDADVLASLKQVLGDELSVYLDPRYQSWYFDCIEALPLSGEMTLDRTVSLKGDTQELKLSLPMYSAQLGGMTLSYSRTQGEGDLPGSSLIRLDSESWTAEVNWQEYSSMTGVNVMQGTLACGPAAGFTVSDETVLSCAVNFTLRQETTEGKDENGLDLHTYNASLTLAPADGEAFPETEIVLASAFASEERKSAATDMSATLTLSTDDEAVELTMNGKSRKKWDPVALPSAPVENADWNALLPGAGVRALAALSAFITVPQTAAE